MTFWTFMLIMTMITPVIMIVIGLIFFVKPPKKINFIIGYRTKMSMKNEDTWFFAHKFSGKLILISGLVLLPITFLSSFFTIEQNENVVGAVSGVICFCQVAVILVVVAKTEIKLVKTFNRKGERINKNLE
ncbi:MAG: SdpI family protein [Clostridia bacterium]